MPLIALPLFVMVSGCACASGGWRFASLAAFTAGSAKSAEAIGRKEELEIALG